MYINIQNHCTNLLLIIFISLICYINIITGSSFVFDDLEAVLKNKDLDLNRAVINIFYDDFWGTKLLSNYSHKSYRPLTSLFYRLNIFIIGDKNAYWFHTVNLLLYIIVCVLHYFFLHSFLSKSKQKPNIILISSLLFCIHPVHTEVVSSVVGQADLLCALTFFLALLSYKKSILENSVYYYCFTLLLSALSMFFKETGITALAACCFYDWLLIFINLKGLKKQFIKRQIGIIGSAIYLLYFRWKIMNFTEPIFQPADNPASFATNFWTRVFSYNYIYFINMLLLIWPQWLCFDWSMGCISLIENVNDTRILLVVLFWISTCSFVFIQVKRRSQLTLFAIGFCVIPFLPASNILRVGFVIAERVLFLPSIGFCLLISCGFCRIHRFSNKHKYLLTVCFITLCLIFMVRTSHRSKEWINEEDLFTSALEVCPNNAKVHYNIAKIAADKNDTNLAESEYRKAIQLHPLYDQAMNNLANILREKNELVEAQQLLRKAVEIRPEFAAAWMNLGVVYATLNNDIDAENAYLMALKYRKSYSDCYYNLGNLYLKLNRNKEALQAWELAVRANPSHSAAWSNSLVLLDGMGRHSRVLEMGKIALNACPRYAPIHFTLANTLGKLERWQAAESHFQMAIELNPNNALYHSNFGVLYHRWGKREKAIHQYKLALDINPNLSSAIKNLKKLE